MFSFTTGKVLGVFIKNFCLVLRTLSRIQWCNFCIENLNLEFVFVIPTTMLLKMKIINVQSTTLVKVDRNTAKDQLLQDRGKSLSTNSSVIVSTSAFMITKSK